MKNFFLVFILVSKTVYVARGWTLSPLNITSSDASVIHVSVYYGRAFLCLRHDKNFSLPTLVEASWPENLIGTRPKIFPSEAIHLRRARKCKGIKQAQATDIDSNSRLWVIDNGDDICSAKIILYDLLYFNDEVGEVKIYRIWNFLKTFVDPPASVWRPEGKTIFENHCRSSFQ